MTESDGRPWVRLYAKFAFDPKVQKFAFDPKVQVLSEAMQRRLIMLHCMARQYPLCTLTEEELAWALRLSVEDLAQTKETLQGAGFINENWDLLNWGAAGDRPSGEIWRKIRDFIFQRDDYTCQYCGIRGAYLECDHVVPVAKGGGHGNENLVTACFACNRSKRAKTVEEWRAGWIG